MDDDDDYDYMPPANTYTFAIPNEPALLDEYELYRPSPATRKLQSERNREVYTEAFIENERLGTLADLAVRALAKLGARYLPPQVAADPLKLRVFYDALDVNLPLADCYFVEDMRFWRRVVLASDKSLELKKLDEYDWRGKGISVKYVDLVEACPAAYWPEKKMAALGQMVREFVRTMHIRHLQSLTDDAFSHYVDSESELDVTSDLSEDYEISSDERDTEEEVEEEGEEEEEEVVVEQPKKKRRGSGVRIAEEAVVVATISDMDMNMGPTASDTLDIADLEQQKKRRQARYSRNAARQQLRELQREKLEEHERRKLTRERLRKPPEPEPKKKKKKKANKAITGVFSMQVDPEPDDGEDKIADGRNKEKLLNHIKRYDYPAKHCHHIDLSFVRYFDQLVSLTIEFLGPEMERNFHPRHLNFSYDDMKHLAKGLRTLQMLKIFRLRNSRMDSIKLLILALALKQLDSLEVVDFGYDELNDECAVAFEMLLTRQNMLRALELEYNKLGSDCLESIATVLNNKYQEDPEGKPLEYLGLAHNPMNYFGLDQLVTKIIGTHHVQELNLTGVQVEPSRFVHSVGTLLRQHSPLRRLDMAAVVLNHATGLDLICALETNHKILHFDCRACDLDLNEEFEADIILRRNEFELHNPYLGDETQTEESLLTYLGSLRHPTLAKLQENKDRQDECISNRPPVVFSQSTDGEAEEPQVEEQEEEYDVWKVFGGQKTVVVEPEREKSISIGEVPGKERFVYNSNDFTWDEVREYLHIPGPGNRYYYFQKQKEKF